MNITKINNKFYMFISFVYAIMLFVFFIISWNFFFGSGTPFDIIFVTFCLISLSFLYYKFIELYPNQVEIDNETLKITYTFRNTITVPFDTIIKVGVIGNAFKFGDIKIWFANEMSINLLESSENFYPFFHTLLKKIKICEIVDFEEFYKTPFLHPDDIAVIKQEVNRIQNS